MKGIVFGAGFLGTRIANEFGYELVGREVNVLNSDFLSDFLDKEKPDIVVNAIGKTGRPNIDWCESHKEETFEANVTIAENLAASCSKKGIYFVHLGSGCIYRGNNNGKGYSEEDEPNLQGQFYAKTKILAEKRLKKFPCLQIRIRMPIDDRPHERNLIDKLVKYSKVLDAQNSMTTVPHMLSALEVLVERKKTGVYNLTNPSTISPAEIMQMYKEIIEPSHEFEAISLEKLDKETEAKRSNCMLNTAKLESEGIGLPEIPQSVEECLLGYMIYQK
ncbi:sugar nucleotide-binding protein [Candidatus Pacearchaeota archaeon]|nr:sugar nucleotide-binding protein [Candidatus Pacearchaeota archaeon]